MSRSRLLDWLRTAPVGTDGTVASWCNDRHPGYPYPEAAGVWLRVMAPIDGADAPHVGRVAARLVGDVGPMGGAGRDGIEYAFDTAIAIAGLRSANVVAPEGMLRFLSHSIAARTACTQPAASWSRAFGCHLLKTAVAAPAAVEPIVDELSVALSDERYTHAWCYGVEGLLVLGQDVRGHAEWLAMAQHDSGGLRAFRDRTGPLRADATAQAVRIWACVDPAVFAGPIDQGLAFLASAQHPSGGIRYESDSEDVNTWVSAFTLQALDWAEHGGRPACLA